MKPYRTGQVAQRAGVRVDTVRFYERQGLIPEPPRTRSGYRQYPCETVDRLRFIQRAKTLGFMLEETRELLELRLNDGARSADVRRRAGAKLREIDRKIQDLRKMRSPMPCPATIRSAIAPAGLALSALFPTVGGATGSRSVHGVRLGRKA